MIVYYQPYLFVNECHVDVVFKPHVDYMQIEVPFDCNIPDPIDDSDSLSISIESIDCQEEKVDQPCPIPTESKPSEACGMHLDIQDIKSDELRDDAMLSSRSVDSSSKRSGSRRVTFSPDSKPSSLARNDSFSSRSINSRFQSFKSIGKKKNPPEISPKSPSLYQRILSMQQAVGPDIDGEAEMNEDACEYDDIFGV